MTTSYLPKIVDDTIKECLAKIFKAKIKIMIENDVFIADLVSFEK